MSGIYRAAKRDQERNRLRASIAEMEATIERLKVGGNCAHWFAGLLGCEMDPDQEVVCEGRDHCKVFNQAVGGPREPCWAERSSP